MYSSLPTRPAPSSPARSRAAASRHGALVAATGLFTTLSLAPAVVQCAAAPAIPNPHTLVGVGPAFPGAGRPLAFREALSAPEYLDVRDGSVALERVVAWDLGRRRLEGGNAPERVLAAFWWDDPLATLEVRPFLGRTFLAEEIEERAKVAMLSERPWRRLFGGDPTVIGKTVAVEGEPHHVVGIVPPGVVIHDTDLWLPMWAPATALPRERRQFQILARMRPGATLEAVDAELGEIARRVEEANVAQHPEYEGWSLTARTWHDIELERTGGR